MLQAVCSCHIFGQQKEVNVWCFVWAANILRFYKAMGRLKSRAVPRFLRLPRYASSRPAGVAADFSGLEADILHGQVLHIGLEDYKFVYLANPIGLLLFCDITEFVKGKDDLKPKGTTAYRSFIKVPGNIGALIAGLSYIDFSALNPDFDVSSLSFNSSKLLSHFLSHSYYFYSS
ncbi:hypothetical protein EJ06DRAFT_574333 [Trichodelitschia bisporula]|uniref:Uncharacterized protein n=1 Tax=Trichodelitschia bisporula TaxID=703511 RepID=A0A6G1I2F9_9PEZI|nr:hypothetical protein EJ06DRAFT_574333 [Trichodelitschia bisporula]